jgi:hypothetical protein
LLEVLLVIESPFLFFEVFVDTLTDASILESKSPFEPTVVAEAVARQAEQGIEQG